MDGHFILEYQNLMQQTFLKVDVVYLYYLNAEVIILHHKVTQEKSQLDTMWRTLYTNT